MLVSPLLFRGKLTCACLGSCGWTERRSLDLFRWENLRSAVALKLDLMSFDCGRRLSGNRGLGFDGLRREMPTPVFSTQERAPAGTKTSLLGWWLAPTLDATMIPSRRSCWVSSARTWEPPGISTRLSTSTRSLGASLMSSRVSMYRSLRRRYGLRSLRLHPIRPPGLTGFP